MKKIIFLTLLFFPIIIFSQIDCKPTVGFAFKPIKKGVSLLQKPNSNSSIALKSPNANDVWLRCTSSRIVNGFIEVKVDFLDSAFRKNGVNNNLYWLHNYLTEEYNYKFDFKTFIDFINKKKNQLKVYNQLINDKENKWFKNYSSADSYDVSTFKGFYKNWIYYDKSKSNDQYIINNQDRRVYIHKSDISNEGNPSPILNDASSDYYLKFLKEQLNLKKEISCLYKEEYLISYFEFYANALMREENFFKVIQEINKYAPQFKNSKNSKNSKIHFLLDFLKVKASYFDKNYVISNKVAENLINSFKKNKLSNTRKKREEDLDMARVYGFLVSGLLQNGQYKKALNYSEECERNKNLQYEQHLVFYGIALLNTDKKIKACNVLNKAYLKGNETARDLINKNCK